MYHDVRADFYEQATEGSQDCKKLKTRLFHLFFKAFNDIFSLKNLNHYLHVLNQKLY